MLFPRLSWFLGALLAGTAAATAADAAAQGTALQPTDVFAFRSARDPQISPDGKRVLYLQEQADVVQDEFQASLWIIGADGLNGHPLTQAKENAGSARWSPDGRRVAFMATREGGRAPFPWTVFCLCCWVIFVFICLLLASYNAGRSGAAGVRSARFFLGDLACP